MASAPRGIMIARRPRPSPYAPALEAPRRVVLRTSLCNCAVPRHPISQPRHWRARGWAIDTRRPAELHTHGLPVQRLGDSRRGCQWWSCRFTAHPGRPIFGASGRWRSRSGCRRRWGRGAGGSGGGGGRGGSGNPIDQGAPLGGYTVTLDIGGAKHTQKGRIVKTQGWTIGPVPQVIR